MILITSGTFVSEEFRNEIGQLPPTFLPLANKRLYEHQIGILKKAFPQEQIYLSLPQEFFPLSGDLRMLSQFNISTVSLPYDLALGDSLLLAINLIGHYHEPLVLLHGDTLLENLPVEADVIAVSQFSEDYNWEIEYTSQNEAAWVGFFSFSKTDLLAKSLAKARGNFVKGVRYYQAEMPLQIQNVNSWSDLGHLNSYYQTRANHTTERNFNRLSIKDGLVRKSGTDRMKITMEANWFESIPPSLKKYVPQFIQKHDSPFQTYYEIEYLPSLPLSELWVFGLKEKYFWVMIFNNINRILEEFQDLDYQTIFHQRTNKVQKDFEELVRVKTCERLLNYTKLTEDNWNSETTLNGVKLPSIQKIITECSDFVINLPSKISFSHGDLCFSNILYDTRSKKIKLIDPRGLATQGDCFSIGDARYDIAKLTQSVIGGYDHIVCGYFTLNEVSSLNFEFSVEVDVSLYTAQDAFLDSVVGGYRPHDLLPLVVLLFLSMIPLHSESSHRQRAFLANALRIYSLWKEI